MKKNNSYLLRNGPSLLLPLGAGFVMASSADVRAALGMGAAVILVLLLSSVVISALHKLIPARGHVPAYLLIITGFVSLIQMLMEAYFPDVVNMLGVHLAALAVSAVPFRDAEEIADKQSMGKTLEISLFTGVCFLVVMVVCAVIRELLGSATFCGAPVEFLSGYRIPALAGAFGGYLVLSVVLAIVSSITNRHTAKNDKEGTQV